LEVLRPLGLPYEIILVDDGSTDGSRAVLRQLAARDPQLRVVLFSRNFGQTAAMYAGFQHSRHNVVITLDGDLQNDPADIPRLLQKLDEGYDLVSGWRKDRKDKALTRRLPSILANRLISRVGGVPLHDYGCSLKAYRGHIARGIRVYGEMHRFFPIYAKWQGARIAEIVVQHHARQFGHSKYGLSRTTKVIFDLLLIRFLAQYRTKPIHLFGKFTVRLVLAGLLSWGLALGLHFGTGRDFFQSGLLPTGACFLGFGVLSYLLGLMAEVQKFTYYESQDRKPYEVAEVLEG
jgi:glycosyltransferase involved in cell wall biosynthesis